MRSPLTEIYDRAKSLVEQINALSEDERNLVLDLLLPEPEPKKTRKRTAKAEPKSRRASGMAAQLNKSLAAQRRASEGACIYILENGAVCNTGADNPIHDKSMGYASYHPFQSAASTTAPSASRRSSRRTKPSEAEPLSIVNSETDTEGVSVAAGVGD